MVVGGGEQEGALKVPETSGWKGAADVGASPDVETEGNRVWKEFVLVWFWFWYGSVRVWLGFGYGSVRVQVWFG